MDVLLLLDFNVMIFWSPYSQYAWHQIFWTSIYHQNFISVWRLQCSVIVNLKCWVNKPETYSNNCCLILTVVLGWACLRYGLLKFQRAKLESCPNILKLLHSAQLVTFLLPDLRLAQLNVSYTHKPLVQLVQLLRTDTMSELTRLILLRGNLQENCIMHG